MEDYSRPHNGLAAVGIYDTEKLDAGLGSMVEGFERAADQIKGQQVMVFPAGREGVDVTVLGTGAVLGPPAEQSVEQLVDAIRALIDNDEELTVDILLGIEGDDIPTLAFFVNKLGAMLIARGSVDEIGVMMEAREALKKKEKAEQEKK